MYFCRMIILVAATTLIRAKCIVLAVRSDMVANVLMSDRYASWIGSRLVAIGAEPLSRGFGRDRQLMSVSGHRRSRPCLTVEISSGVVFLAQQTGDLDFARARAINDR
jgi:hypothetical protein